MRDDIVGAAFLAIAVPVYYVVWLIGRERAPSPSVVMGWVGIVLGYGFMAMIAFLLAARFVHLWPFSN